MKSGPELDRLRGHAARMFAWEDQVRQDMRLCKTPYALHLVVFLRRLVRPSGEPIVGEQRWLAEQIGVSLRTLVYAVRALKRFGHLEVRSGKLSRTANGYLPVVANDVRNTLRTLPVSAAPCVVDAQPGAHVKRNPLHRSTSFKTSSNSWKRLAKKPEQLEQAIREALGQHGHEYLGVLAEIDDGRPYQEAIDVARREGVTDRLIASIRLRCAQHFRETGFPPWLEGEARRDYKASVR